MPTEFMSDYGLWRRIVRVSWPSPPAPSCFLSNFIEAVPRGVEHLEKQVGPLLVWVRKYLTFNLRENVVGRGDEFPGVGLFAKEKSDEYLESEKSSWKLRTQIIKRIVCHINTCQLNVLGNFLSRAGHRTSPLFHKLAAVRYKKLLSLLGTNKWG